MNMYIYSLIDVISFTTNDYERIETDHSITFIVLCKLNDLRNKVYTCKIQRLRRFDRSMVNFSITYWRHNRRF